MIESLKTQRDNVYIIYFNNFLYMKRSKILESSLSYKSNPSNYKYKTNTLYTNLVLESIYKERSYLL